VRQKQRDKLRQFFMFHRDNWVPLPDILKLGIAQYNARIFDLKSEGMEIINKIEIVNGNRHSWYKYVYTKEGNQARLF